jgi:hypothetical protein
MSLEGLRAWIAEVERKLGRRTRVFLALAAIAIGVAGASLYLAIDAKDSSVSEGDVRALQEKLEARIDEVAAEAAAARAAPSVEAQPAPRQESQGGKQGGAANGVETQKLLEQARERSEANR